MEINEIQFYDELIKYQIPQISDNIRFWMIRTKKGYFYEEYVMNGYVALGWNSINKDTDLSDELLPGYLKRDHNVKQSTKVINKCNYFINEIKENDIIIIPNRGLEEISIVLAGEYYEDKDKTIKLENDVTWKIDNNQGELFDIECPYKKRRHVTLLRRVKADRINYHLYRTLRNYNGIDDIDEHAELILGMLFEVFSYRHDIHIIVNVNQKNDIGLSELSGLLYGSKEYFSHFVNKSQIKAKINLSSEGEILIILKDVVDYIYNHGYKFIGLFISFITTNKILKLNEVPPFIKDLFTLKELPKREKIKTDTEYEILREKRLKNDILEIDLEAKKSEAKKNEVKKLLMKESINGIPTDFEKELIINAINPLEIGQVILTNEATEALKSILEKEK